MDSNDKNNANPEPAPAEPETLAVPGQTAQAHPFDQELNSPPPPQITEVAPNTEEAQVQQPAENTEPDQAEESPSGQSEVVGTYKPSRIPVLTILILLVTLIIAVGLVYFGYQAMQGNTNFISNIIGTDSQSPVPTETEKQSEITLVEGSVYEVTSDADYNVLVSKEDYPEAGIIGFAKVTTSPDKQYMCFESYSPAPSPRLYISPVKDGTVSAVGDNYRNCAFTPDSKRIVFTDTPTLTEDTHIYLYTIESGDLVNLTEDLDLTDTVNTYAIEGFSDDGATLECSVTTYQGTNANEEACALDISSVESGNSPDISPVLNDEEEGGEGDVLLL